MALMEIKKLKKHFDLGSGNKVHAVDGISIDIQEKEIIGLVGESGSGKSTFGRTLCGLWDKTEGEVHFQGKTLPNAYSTKDFKLFSKDIQMIFQDPYSSLNPRMTVKEIVGEGLKLQGKLSSKQINEKVALWLKRVGLEPEHMSRYPHEFSGGQRQRIGIARALIVEPKFVVCDEPISALDVSIQAQVVNLLEDIKNEMGLTLLFIAHDLSMVRYVSDRMAVMYLGAMVELGPTDDVYFRPKHPYTKLLVESNPEPDPKKERSRKSVAINGEIPSPINIGEGCRFAGRCPHTTSICKEKTPKWQEIGEQHFVACHLYE